MMRPPTIAPEIEVRPPRISTGSALSAMSESENCTPLFAPHMIPATRATPPDTDHTMTQMVFRGIPIGESRLVVVRHRPEEPARWGSW